MENTEEISKRCTKCGIVKPLSDFFKRSASKDGLSPTCKPCALAYGKQYQTENKVSISAQRKNFREENKESLQQAHREWWRENADEINAKRRLPSFKGRQKSIVRSREFYYTNKESLLAEQKEDRRNNPSVYLIKSAKQRANRKSVPFSLTPEDVLIPEFCPILGIKLKQQEKVLADCSPTIDRIRPELGYVAGNVAVISHKANTVKNDGTSEEHRKIADWMDGLYSIKSEKQKVDKLPRSWLSNLKFCAKKSGVPFVLTPRDVEVPTLCPVFGTILERGKINAGPNSPTIDKMIPELGYIPENISVISYRANRIKHKGTAAEHRLIADWIDSQTKAA